MTHGLKKAASIDPMETLFRVCSEESGTHRPYGDTFSRGF